ncbi:aromatic-ring-hydroxylating dioxygenase subunit beta [Cupriavidus sp. L7L]|uniref:aromatic-ring-hydroxylating dioxygenase subunit beta n=1 Tax=Cupriavidus sp. L7L TaxID=2546443 RepID=UPI0014044CB7|nr:aromatic-ring-hydroxylating dioxygenase subunit beta [Cupriavidus sp. L7L]
MSNAIQSLVLREAQLLDEGKLDDWLALYAEDATYWLPIDENADPMQDSSIIYDNRMRLEMRVEQIMRQARVAQSPASSTLHMVSNLDIDEEGADRARATFALLVVEVRSGDWRQTGLGETRLFPGRCTMSFTRVGDDWKITDKTFVLLNRKQPLIGLSFLL